MHGIYIPTERSISTVNPRISPGVLMSNLAVDGGRSIEGGGGFPNRGPT